MNIALPESLEPLVRRRVVEGGYASAAEYVRDLILADQEPTAEWENLTDPERRDVERISQTLVKSLDCGPPVAAGEAFFEEMRQRLRERRAGGT